MQTTNNKITNQINKHIQSLNQFIGRSIYKTIEDLINI